jgi:two-component system sensor histidine kinase/response regulator
MARMDNRPGDDELKVHQLELEIQNEELRQAQGELDAVRARYFDLYDLAPVGYLTLSEKGLILEANLTAASLLGIERGALVTQRFASFIFPEDGDIYYLRRKKLFETGEPQACEFRLARNGSDAFWARVEAALAHDADGSPVCRVVLSDITAQKKDADALRHNEERHRAILQTGMDGFWRADAQGRLLEVNETYCRMSGYSTRELLTMSIPDLEVNESARDTAERIQQIMAQGEFRFESRHRRKDGSIFDVEVSVQYRSDDRFQLVAFLRDITERKKAEEEHRETERQVRSLLEDSKRDQRALLSILEDQKETEEALRESEEKFQTLARVMPVGIFRTDADGRSIYVNEAMCRMTGRTFEESLGFGWLEGLHPDDRARVYEEWGESVKNQLPFKTQSRLVHKNGSLVRTVAEADAVVDAKGKILGYVGTITDITDLKEAEESLRNSEDELRSLNEDLERHVGDRTRELEDARRVALSMLQDADIQRRNTEEILKKLAESTSRHVMLWQAVENSPAIVVVTDPEANIQYVNPKFVEVTGYSAEEVIGKNPRILKSGEHTPEFYQHLWATIKAGKTWFGEFCNRKKSGDLYWEAASISPVRASDGGIHQFLAIKEDVTEFKRTAEVLMRAKEEADAANQAKSAFLASMSHEIRTPLNAILGYSQLVLRDEALGAGTRESLHIINRSGEHLLALINDVLEVAKIEAGRLGLDPAEFDLHAMLDDLAAMFRLPAMEKGIGLQFTKAKDLPRYVIADEGKTRQVLINILGNAVKFTKQGHVSVGAAVSRAESGQLWLAVEVEDTGSGIAPEEMGKLFQYFEQTRSGRETLSGTGLGLVISRDYARKMGGDISVASEQGKGSVFRFEIPIAPIAAKPAGELPDSRRVAGLEPGQAALRVLVVDDEVSNRGWLCALLESVGFEVREAGNGREALEIWQAWRPGLILMDMRMPLMDGYEATRRIRLAPGGDSTVIIALTASALDEPLPAMMEAGVDDLVCKPFKEGHLFDRIKTHLEVRFRYDESEEFTKAQSGELASPTAISLSGLPAELLTGMKRAILGCDMDGFLQLLPQVAEQDPSVVARLRTLAEKYDYDALARIVSEAE